MHKLITITALFAAMSFAGAAGAVDTFNPQPDPPGRHKLTDSFNPQPDPPGRQRTTDARRICHDVTGKVVKCAAPPRCERGEKACGDRCIPTDKECRL